MKDTKRELPLFSMYDHTGMERHLEEMAARGWMLEKTSGLGWRYRRTEPRRVRYAVTYFPKASAYDPGPSEDQLVFRDYCTEAGWELVSSAAQMQIFRSEAESPLPIETDAAMQVENTHRAMKRAFLPSHLSLVILALLQMGLLVWRLRTDPIGTLSQNSTLFTVFCWFTTLVIGVWEIVSYGRWYRRAKAAAEENGRFTPTHSHRRFQAVMLTAVLAGLLIWLLGSLLESAYSFALVVAGLLHVALVIAAVSLLSWFLKRKNVPARVNRTVTIISAFVMASLGTVILGFGIFRLSDTGWLSRHQAVDSYEAYGITLHIYHDSLPLTIEDLTGQTYKDVYSYELDRSASLLVERAEGRQDARMDVKISLPDLRYEIITPRPFLYGLCKQGLLGEVTRWNEGIPQEHWDEYRPADLSGWDAEEVYQGYSSGEPRDEYLVCWPDRIVKITFDWTPTAEQITIAAAKLLAA